MATEDTDVSLARTRKITVPAMPRTLGRPKSKHKSRPMLHGSFGKLNVGNDKLRPDSGYYDSILGQDPSGIAPANAENISLCSSIASEDMNMEKYRKEALLKIQELIDTEKRYVEDLKAISSFYNYMQESKIKPTPTGIAPMPDGLSEGKDRIVFANSRDILDFHQRSMLPELEKSLDDINVITNLFIKRKTSMKDKYGKFCINQPKAEYIVTEFEEYFNLVRMALDQNQGNSHQPLDTLLMTPVQRVTRYTLLLGDIAKCFKKAGDEESHDIINTAKDHANEICECANDMMYAGRISGFPGIITKQGLLLLREEATCFKKRSNRILKPKLKDAMIFIFREKIVVCEKSPQLFSSANFSSYPQINYWVSFQMKEVNAEVLNKDDTNCSFELERSEKDASSNSEDKRIIVKCKDEQSRDHMIQIIADQRALISNIADMLTNPNEPTTNPNPGPQRKISNSYSSSNLDISKFRHHSGQI